MKRNEYPPLREFPLKELIEAGIVEEWKPKPGELDAQVKQLADAIYDMIYADIMGLTDPHFPSSDYNND